VVKSAHVITFEGGRTQAKLGRGHESDVRINDISVSPNHAVINFTDNKFRLEDCTSKFGTLVRLAETVRLQGKVTVQLGRSLISLEEKLI
jgi:pSer/pThr/pTyr-binding forkhead associated (FHA) protein